VLLAVAGSVLGVSAYRVARARDQLDAANGALTAAEQREETARRQAEEPLGRLDVSNGVHRMDQGELVRPLTWVREAMRAEQADPARAEVHRERLAAVLKFCPRLTQVVFGDAPVEQVSFSPDGRRLLVATTDGRARVWDADSGQPVSAVIAYDPGDP